MSCLGTTYRGTVPRTRHSRQNSRARGCALRAWRWCSGSGIWPFLQMLCNWQGRLTKQNQPYSLHFSVQDCSVPAKRRNLNSLRTASQATLQGDSPLSSGYRASGGASTTSPSPVAPQHSSSCCCYTGSAALQPMWVNQRCGRDQQQLLQCGEPLPTNAVTVCIGAFATAAVQPPALSLLDVHSTLQPENMAISTVINK